MPVEAILDLLRASGGGNPRVEAEKAARLIRKRGLQADALVATSAAMDPASRWLHASLAEEAGAGPHTLDDLWARVVDGRSRDFFDALVQRARLAWRQGSQEKAAAFLRQALFCDWDAPALVRTESLAKKVFSGGTFRRTVRIALLSSSNTMMLRSALQLICWRDRLNAEFYEPDYGTYQQEILTPGSRLYSFRPDFAVVLRNWRDLALPANPAEAPTALHAALSTTRQLWARLLAESDSTVIEATVARPPFDPASGVSLRSEGGTANFLDNLNLGLVQDAPARVLFVDSAALAARTVGQWEDPRQWSASRVYPSLEALPLLAESIVSNIRYSCGFSSKLLAVDLDNTLWGGIIGEDGMEGIHLGPPSPEGERFQNLHHYLKFLLGRGVVLAAVSKNNREDAERVFNEHDASVLKLSDFAAFEANWGPKADSLRRIATYLRLGLDSFVFLDDNPAERAAIRAELPEVVVPNVSGEPADSIAAIERFQFFQTAVLTEEDRTRAASYKALAAVNSFAGASDLLVSLQIEIETGPVDATTANRVTQLINKTNQFNLTTRRYTAAEVEERIKSPSHWFRWFRLRDRFADHGLVGIILAAGTDSAEWEVDLWLMSCRVIGRKLEEFMFNSLLDAAHAAGATSVLAEYLPTAKNEMVKHLLPTMGFLPLQGSPGKFSIDPRTATRMDIPFPVHQAGNGASK